MKKLNKVELTEESDRVKEESMEAVQSSTL